MKTLHYIFIVFLPLLLFNLAPVSSKALPETKPKTSVITRCIYTIDDLFISSAINDSLSAGKKQFIVSSGPQTVKVKVISKTKYILYDLDSDGNVIMSTLCEKFILK